MRIGSESRPQQSYRYLRIPRFSEQLPSASTSMPTMRPTHPSFDALNPHRQLLVMTRPATYVPRYVPSRIISGFVILILLQFPIVVHIYHPTVDLQLRSHRQGALVPGFGCFSGIHILITLIDIDLVSVSTCRCQSRIEKSKARPTKRSPARQTIGSASISSLQL